MRPVEDMHQVLGILWEAWRVVNGADLKYETTFEFRGETMKMPAVEAQLWLYLQQNNRVWLALEGSTVCGIMVWSPVFDGIMAVRMLYYPESHRKKGLGIGLVCAIPGMKKVLFQTMKAFPPELFLGHVANRSRRLYEDDTLITWETDLTGEE